MSPQEIDALIFLGIGIIVGMGIASGLYFHITRQRQLPAIGRRPGETELDELTRLQTRMRSNTMESAKILARAEEIRDEVERDEAREAASRELRAEAMRNPGA